MGSMSRTCEWGRTNDRGRVALALRRDTRTGALMARRVTRVIRLGQAQPNHMPNRVVVAVTEADCDFFRDRLRLT